MASAPSLPPGKDYGIYDRLLKDRIVFLGEVVDDTVANIVVAQMLFLQSQSRADITLYINSPGGSVSASFAISDAMATLGLDVATVCVGQATGTALLLLASGRHGKRFALPTSRIRFSELQAGGQSSAYVIADYQRAQRQVIEHFTGCTGMSAGAVEQAMRTELACTLEQGIELGLFDKIVIEPAKPLGHDQRTGTGSWFRRLIRKIV